MSPKQKLEAIEALIADYAWCDGEHHKQWVIDQIIRILKPDGEEYQKFIEWAFEYQWHEGIAP